MARKQAPATKAGKLMEQLGRLSAARELDDFAIRRVERAAKALMDVDRASAHTALGGAAALRGDAEAARSHHRIALRLADNETTQFNYAVSLSLLEETEEAFEVATAALERFPDDLALLGQATTAALESGHFRAARSLCDRWNAMVPDRAHQYSRLAQRLADAVDTGTITEDAVRSLLKVANGVQRDAHVRSMANRIGTLDTTDDFGPDQRDSGPSYLYVRQLHAEPTLASALNEQLADRVATRPDLLENPGLTFTVGFVGTSADGSEP